MKEICTITQDAEDVQVSAAVQQILSDHTRTQQQLQTLRDEIKASQAECQQLAVSKDKMQSDLESSIVQLKQSAADQKASSEGLAAQLNEKLAALQGQLENNSNTTNAVCSRISTLVSK